MDKNSELGTAKIPRLLASYSATTLAALLFNSLYTLADALFVSWGVGAAALGGVSVAFPFVLIQSAVSTALGGGAASIISRRLGEGKRGEAGAAALNAMISFWVSALCIGGLGLLFMEPVLSALGAPLELRPYTRDYLTIIMAGNLFSTGFSAIIRAEGRMKYALLIWVVPVSVNLILDPIFIFLLGWGVRGSAAATVICQFTSFSLSIVFFTRFSSLSFKGARLRARTLAEILATGFPSLVQQGGMAAGLVITNNVLEGAGGGTAVTVYAYVNRIVAFAVMPFMAITQALAPIAGYNYGAGNHERLREAVRYSLLLALLWAALSLAAGELLPRQLLALFTADQAILAAALRVLRICALVIPCYPMAMIAGAVRQAQGKKGSALLLYSLQILFLIPALFLGRTLGGLDGIWRAIPAAGFCATAASGAALLGGPRFPHRMAAEEPGPVLGGSKAGSLAKDP
ncbi:MAG: MATE family efflux transporter [Treponema sp.]|nr:MATE family efflux transporter [Treponema sp.]